MRESDHTCFDDGYNTCIKHLEKSLRERKLTGVWEMIEEDFL